LQMNKKCKEALIDLVMPLRTPLAAL